MPFADVAGTVAGALHDLPPERHTRIELQLAERAVAKASAAGDQLRTAGMAQRMSTGGTREDGAAANEFIEVWRFDRCVAECMNGIGALVIGDNQQHVRPVRRGGPILI